MSFILFYFYFIEWKNDEIVHLIAGRKLFNNDWKTIKMTFDSKFNLKTTNQLRDKWRTIKNKLINNQKYFDKAEAVIFIFY